MRPTVLCLVVAVSDAGGTLVAAGFGMPSRRSVKARLRDERMTFRWVCCMMLKCRSVGIRAAVEEPKRRLALRLESRRRRIFKSRL